MTNAFREATDRSTDALKNQVPELLAQAQKQFDGGDTAGGIDSLFAALLAPVTPFNAVGGVLASALGQPLANLGQVVTALSRPEFVTGLTLSLVGPLISTVGAAGVAFQDVVDAFGSGDPTRITNALVKAPATILDGFLNGGYGPDLSPLLTGGIAAETATLAGDGTARIERRKVYAGGILSGVQVAKAEERSIAIDDGSRILPGPIGGLQATRLTVARALNSRRYLAAAADVNVASEKSVTLTVAPSVDASTEKVASVGDSTPKADTDGKVKRPRATGLRAGAHKAPSVQKVGKHRKADSQ